MALTINLTLAVQIVHFLIAYALISRFLLKPGYKAVKVDEDRLRQLRQLVISEGEILAQKQEYKRQRWLLCQNYFYQNRPAIERESAAFTSFKTIEQAAPLSDKKEQSLIHDVSEHIKRRVLNG